MPKKYIVELLSQRGGFKDTHLFLKAKIMIKVETILDAQERILEASGRTQGYGECLMDISSLLELSVKEGSITKDASMHLANVLMNKYKTISGLANKIIQDEKANQGIRQLLS